MVTLSRNQEKSSPNSQSISTAPTITKCLFTRCFKLLAWTCLTFYPRTYLSINVSIHLATCHFMSNYSQWSARLCCAALRLVPRSCLTLCDPMECSPPGSSVHGESPGRHIGVGHHVLLQGIFPTQGSNPSLLHCRRILYHLSHQGRSWILQWIAYPFSRGSPRPRNWTRISRITGRDFTAEPPAKSI